jgi:hypothetical protein
LRKAGDAFPAQGPPWTLYRGISRGGEARNPEGFSWTASLDQACWFAIRYRQGHPEILTAIAEFEDVLFFYGDFDEGEFVCNPRWTKLDISQDEIVRRGMEVERRRVEDDRELSGDASRES